MLTNTDSSRTYTVEEDLRILSLMTNRIDAYVRGSELYGNQGMFIYGLPAITLGGVLMRIRRLSNLRGHLNESQRLVLDSTIVQHDKAYIEWMRHYEMKAQTEAASRADRIEQFIQEYQDNSNQYMNALEPEQTRRTIIQEILYMMQRTKVENPALLERIQDIDEKLSSIVVSSTFQWSPILEEVYPRDVFWWLYSTLDSGD